MLQHGMKGMGLCLILAALVGPGCVAASKYGDIKQKYMSTLDELEAARASLDEVEALLAEVDMSNESYRQQALEAQRRAAELEAMVQDLEARGGLPVIDGATGVYDPLRGEVGYSMLGDVTFAPGSANLTKDGERILRDVARELKKHGLKIRVDGHTDSDPVVKTKDQWPEGNIQLGAGRAISVYKFLVGEGITPEKLSIASYAEHRPAVDGTSSAAKKKNRRVEVMMILEPSSTAS